MIGKEKTKKNVRKGGRVVEGAALEKRYPACGIEGSNPSLSANPK